MVEVLGTFTVTSAIGVAPFEAIVRTVYEVSALPPLLSGATHEMIALEPDWPAVTFVGRSGVVLGVAATTAPVPAPSELTDETRMKYVTPLVKPVPA